MDRADTSWQALRTGISSRSGVNQVIVPAPQRVLMMEVEDAFFHLNSAVLLPAGPTASERPDSESELLSGLGVIYATYRFFDDYPEKRLVIAAHTDTSGEVRPNFELSQLRGDNVRALLTGDAQRWGDTCDERHRVSDVQLILKHVHQTLHWPCDPGPVDDIAGDMTRGALQRFREAFNEERVDLGLTGASEMQTPSLSNDRLNRETWDAFFALYRWEIAGLLGTTPDELTSWTDRVRFVNDDCKVLACGESFPIDEPDRSNYRSQQNRRVELLFFDEGAAPEVTCLAPRDTVYTVEECPVYNPARYERAYLDPAHQYLAWVALQAVDEFGHPVAGAELVLRHQEGITADIEVTVDELGYWSRHHVPCGVYDILRPDGAPVTYVADGAEQPATLNTDLAHATVTSVLVERNATDEERQQMREQRAFYGRSTSEDVPDTISGRGGPEPSPHRVRFYATDNVALAAGWTEEGACDLEALVTELHTWLGDYFPEARRRGYVVQAITAEPAVHLYVWEDDAPRSLGTFPLKTGVIGAIGAYAVFEINGAYYRDMATRSRGIGIQDETVLPDEVASGSGSIPINELVADEQRPAYDNALSAYANRVDIAYLTPTGGDFVHLALTGGMGRFESYGRSEAVNEHVHHRNRRAAASISYGYDAALRPYIEDVEEAPSVGAIREMGPPPSPYTFPRPVGSTFDQYREILDALNEGRYGYSSYRAWVAISQRVDVLAGRIPDGTMFFRCKFVLKQRVEAGDTSPYDEVKVEWNFDVTEHGVFRKKSTTNTVGIQAGAGPVSAGANQEVNLETGDGKTTVHAKLGDWGIEMADDGGQKVTGPYGASAEGNLRTGEFGYGTTLSTNDLFGLWRRRRTGEEVEDDAFRNWPSAELYVGLHFQGARVNNILAVVSRAPGFFERRSLHELIAPHVLWSDLSLDERTHLETLGWAPDQWDRKYILPYDDFPDSTKQSPHDLSGAEQVAIVHLGFPYDNWTKYWQCIAGVSPDPGCASLIGVERSEAQPDL